jgi:hypothetical protein
VTLLLAVADVHAESDADIAKQDRIDELERKVDVLTEELAKMREDQGLPADEGDLQSYQGLGPAASRIFGIGRGLSIGGYAEAFYRNSIEDGDTDGTDTSDALRAVLYVGYKFTDRIIFNSEIEFEHGTTGTNFDGQSGSVSVELMTLDLLYEDWANLRTGLLLMPVGFLNEIHEPPFFHGVARPEVEQRIIPTTWRENGVGVYGSLGEDTLEYRAYLTTGLDAAGLSSNGIRSARTSGNRSRAEDLAGVFRADWRPFDGALVGGSIYYGGIDQSRSFTNSSTGQVFELDDSTLLLYEAHAQWRWEGLELRGLYARTHLDGAGSIARAFRGANRSGNSIAGDTHGWYVEAAYDVMPWIAPDRGWYLAPFFRFEKFDTQGDVPDGFRADGTKDVRLFTPGLTFKPHPNVAFKIDYRNFAPRQGEQADEVEIGFGVAF